MSDDQPNRRKEVISGRTNPAVYLLMEMLIDDPETPYENDSDFIEASLRDYLAETDVDLEGDYQPIPASGVEQSAVESESTSEDGGDSEGVKQTTPACN